MDGSTDRLLVDSGSALNACPVDHALEYPLLPGGTPAKTASGGELQQMGTRRVLYKFRDGQQAEVRYDVLGVHKLVLSVGLMNRTGVSAHFLPDEAYLEDKHGLRLDLIRDDDVFYLEAELLDPAKALRLFANEGADDGAAAAAGAEPASPST